MEPYLFENMADTEAGHWWFRARGAILAGLIERLELPFPADILDVGAGTGGTTARLAAFGKVAALEVDSEARRFLSRLPLAQLYTNPLPDPAIPDAGFDLITAFDVLEHVPDDVSVLCDIRRLLRPRARFVATVPAHPILWTAHDDHHHHQRRYTRRGLRLALESAGLEVDFCGFWLSTLFPVFVAERTWLKLRPPVDATVQIPSPPLNRALERIVGFERHWLSRQWSPPFGASLLVVAHRV